MGTWKEILGEWAKAFQKRWWWMWIIAVLIYKLIEDWLLETIRNFAQSNSGWFFAMIKGIAENHTWVFLWLPVVITVIVLLALTWRDYKKLHALKIAGASGVGTPTIIQTPARTTKKPSRIKYDNVLWEDGGTRYWGSGVLVIGPMCPLDYVTLCVERRGEIKSFIDDDTFISEHDSRLFCPKCKRKYTFDTKPKRIRDSRGEVENLFEGKRRREQET
jgi:hypothetical protein